MLDKTKRPPPVHARAAKEFTRITIHPHHMRGAPCIRGLPVAVSTIVDMVNDGKTAAQILALHPDLTPTDVCEALEFETRCIQIMCAELEAALAATKEDVVHGPSGARARPRSRSTEDAPSGLPFRREKPRVKRNDLCPCGSGKKYKHCCLQ